MGEIPHLGMGDATFLFHPPAAEYTCDIPRRPNPVDLARSHAGGPVKKVVVRACGVAAKVHFASLGALLYSESPTFDLHSSYMHAVSAIHIVDGRTRAILTQRVARSQSQMRTAQTTGHAM